MSLSKHLATSASGPKARMAVAPHMFAFGGKVEMG
jgi:hypothetical protein